MERVSMKGHLAALFTISINALVLPVPFLPKITFTIVISFSPTFENFLNRPEPMSVSPVC